MAGAVAVLGPTGHVRAADRLTGAGALHRGRVDHPHVIGPHAGVAGKCPQQPVQRGGEAAKPLVVAGLLGQVGEQVAQVLVCEPEPPGLTGVPQQCLHHRQRHHLGVGDHRGDTYRGPPWQSVRMVTTLATNTRWTGGWPVLTARYPYWPSDVERNFDPKLLRREAQGPATWAQPAFDLNHTSGGARPPSWPRSTSAMRVVARHRWCGSSRRPAVPMSPDLGLHVARASDRSSVQRHSASRDIWRSRPATHRSSGYWSQAWSPSAPIAMAARGRYRPDDLRRRDGDAGGDAGIVGAHQ